MTLFSKYEQKLIRLTDDDGNTFTGIADTFPSGYGLHEFGHEEEGIQLGEYTIFRSQIAHVEILPTYEEAVAAIPPGRYRHFKGKDYEVIGIARHSETEEAMVVYRALYGDSNGDPDGASGRGPGDTHSGEGALWVRPAAMWNEKVERNGKTYRRFYRLDRIERVERYEQLFDEVKAEAAAEAAGAAEAEPAWVSASAAGSSAGVTAAAQQDPAARPDPEKLLILETYLTSGEWQNDYEADERGELPPDLKRGVLAQDALYDLLEEFMP